MTPQDDVGRINKMIDGHVQELIERLGLPADLVPAFRVEARNAMWRVLNNETSHMISSGWTRP